ncbi:biotin--[acetyl-CoA-carboxylase] ligase [bacterium]|nr:biotin--[acetyl-CoA-carboxylase] ligase [bacterium]
MNIVRLYEVDSTNKYAKTNLNDLPDKSVITAEKQTAGRGRFNRKWADLGEGNVFMSFILKPSLEFSENYANLTQYLCVTLCKVLETYNLNPQIKWPNDVLIDGKKIAGILSESVVQGGVFKGLVLGIGVNLNSNLNDIMQIKDKEVTALNIELNQEHVDKDEFVENLTEEFFNRYEDFLKTGFVMIKDDYLNKSCFLNKEISVQVFNDKKSGMVKEVNDLGELVLENSGKELVLTMGDIL